MFLQTKPLYVFKLVNHLDMNLLVIPYKWFDCTISCGYEICVFLIKHHHYVVARPFDSDIRGK